MIRREKVNIDYVIIGLGNPEKEYNNTRHNIGVQYLDYVQNICECSNSKILTKSIIFSVTMNDKHCLCVKPRIPMNHSGEFVKDILRIYHIPIENVIVVCDDVVLPVADVRIREKGSSGGHKGLQSIIDELQTENFIRIRVGAGICPNGADLKDWVLEKLSAHELALLQDAYRNVYEAIILIMNNQTQKAMAKFNKKICVSE